MLLAVMLRNSVSLLFFILWIEGSFAQNTSADPVGVVQITYAENIFYNALGIQSPLYSGKEYIDVNRSKGHPFFISNQFTPATIYYDDLVFRDIPVLYDIVRDELVLRNHKDQEMFVLNPLKLEAFTFHGHRFINKLPDPATEIPPGIYEIIHEGKILALARRRKVIDEKVSMVVTREVVQKDIYYLIMGGKTHQVNSQRQLLRIFDGKREAVRDQLRRHKVTFKRQPEAALKHAASINEN